MCKNIDACLDEGRDPRFFLRIGLRDIQLYESLRSQPLLNVFLFLYEWSLHQFNWPTPVFFVKGACFKFARTFVDHALKKLDSFQGKECLICAQMIELQRRDFDDISTTFFLALLGSKIRER